MRVFRFIPLLLGLIVLGCGTPVSPLDRMTTLLSQPQQIPQDWRSYQSRSQHFGFKVPSDWKLTEDDISLTKQYYDQIHLTSPSHASNTTPDISIQYSKLSISQNVELNSISLKDVQKKTMTVNSQEVTLMSATTKQNVPVMVIFYPGLKETAVIMTLRLTDESLYVPFSQIFFSLTL